MRRVDTVYKSYNQDSDCERQLRTLLATEPALRDALHLPAVDENTLDLVIEIAVGRLRELQAVVDAVLSVGFAPADYLELEDSFARACSFCECTNYDEAIHRELGAITHKVDRKLQVLIDALAKLDRE